MLNASAFGAPASVTWVETGAVWKYWVSATPPASTWTTRAFDDSAWPDGPAQFGFGEGDEATEVGFGDDPDNKFITTWFRHTFVVTNAPAWNQIALDLLRDDGAVVYLNGVEVARENLPSGLMNSRTLALTNVFGAGERTFSRVVKDGSYFLPGANVLAVEVHQAAADSIDLSFDLQLTASSVVQLTRGPYLQSGASNGVTIRWRTSAPTESWVRYGRAGHSLDEVVSDPIQTTEHIVRLTGLLAGTRYDYSVGTADTQFGGPEFHFLTAPAQTQPIRIWAIGDAGTADERQRQVRDAYTDFTGSRHTDVWLMLGDNAYYSGFEHEYQAAVFDMYPDLLRRTLLYPALGNHETYSGNFSSFPYLTIFSPPMNGEAGGVPSGSPRYYSFDYANAHFVCLDSMTVSRSSNAVMCAWLRQDLAATEQDWILAYWHHPPYSKGSHDSDWERELVEMRQNVVPILEAYGVDLVLSGHSHSYERSFLLHGHYGHSSTLLPRMILDLGDGHEHGDGAYRKPVSGAWAGRGAVYAVAGSSGQGPSGGQLDHPVMFISLNVLGSLVIDIDGDRLDATFLRETGAIDDRFTIRKSRAPAVLRISSVTRQADTMRIVWESQPDALYRLERASRLDWPDWNPVVEEMPATGFRTVWWDAWDPFNASGFYRVLALPE